MDKARDQVGVFGGFFDGKKGRAELSLLPVVMLIQAIACFIFEQSQTQVFQSILMQTSAVVGRVVSYERYVVQLV